ncbi:MAG: GNAT family N-acetyltransferase [Candidatus Thorarchaeota archaeon]|jgi:ribosomal protein S18 acetylase RimI-like enzyme
MRERKLTVSNEMSGDDWAVISANLYNYNIERSKGHSTSPGTSISLTLKNDDMVVGGINCRAFYQSLSIDHLWIDEEFRGRGYGKELVLRAEEQAKEVGCMSANTSSYSFQAPIFYEKLGYKIVGVFEGYPDGIKKLFFEKVF